MKKTILLGSILLSCSAWSDSLPSVSISFPQRLPSTIFYGETVRIPVQMTYEHLRGNKSWELPSGSTLENVSGACPQIVGDNAYYEHGTCTMALVIKAEHFGAIEGALHYHLNGADTSQQDYYSPVLSVAVIPHSLSMALIPYQRATATIDFVYSLQSAVFYYDENVAAGASPEGVVSPVEQKGLYFDAQRFAILGKPTQPGTYVFTVGAKNIYSSAVPTQLLINVGINPQDTPVFKTDHDIPSATPGGKYSLNLVDLLENNAIFNETNQVTFRLDQNYPKPEGLNINVANLTVLEGSIPKNLAGQVVNATIIATSNTGGDSTESLTIHIPVAADPEQKPELNYFEMEQLAGSQFYTDVLTHISSPAKEANPKIILEKVEPKAGWLHVSALNPTSLEGVIPLEATGQKYLITLRASTIAGGASNATTIPLQISIDKERTPQFKAANPHLPLVYPGQDYFYDFVEHQDVFPEYEDAPYTIEFAKEYEHPTWLKLENNKLFADALVPDDITGSRIELNLIIKNVPGGSSDIITIRLKIMK